MNKNSYMSKNELINWLKLGVLASELDYIANLTKDTDWRKRMRTAKTLLVKIVEERLSLLDYKQLASVARRRQHASVRLLSTDEHRISEKWNKDEKYLITIDQKTLYDLIDMALCACRACSQGEYVAKCRYREMLHQIGVPVARDSVKAGECEFRLDNSAAIIKPSESPINLRWED